MHFLPPHLQNGHWFDIELDFPRTDIQTHTQTTLIRRNCQTKVKQAEQQETSERWCGDHVVHQTSERKPFYRKVAKNLTKFGGINLFANTWDRARHKEGGKRAKKGRVTRWAEQDEKYSALNWQSIDRSTEKINFREQIRVLMIKNSRLSDKCEEWKKRWGS